MTLLGVLIVTVGCMGLRLIYLLTKMLITAVVVSITKRKLKSSGKNSVLPELKDENLNKDKIMMTFCKYIILVLVFLSACSSVIAETVPQVAYSDFDSKSWWLEYAVRQADHISDTDIRDDIYGSLGRVQAITGNIQEANVSASAISKMQNRVYVHIAAAKTAYENGDISGYKATMLQASSAAFSEKRMETCIFINSAMVTAYLDCDDVDGAKIYIESLSDLPDTQRGYHDVQMSYRKIAAYFAQHDNVKEADLVLNNNIKASGKDAALLEIAETCIRKGNLVVAEQMVNRLISLEFKNRVYGKLGAAFAEKGNTAKARSISEIIDNPTNKSFVIAAIVKYQVNSGNIDLATKTAGNINDRDHKIDVYKLMVEKLAEAGKIGAAVEMIEMMVKMIEDTPTVPDESKFGTFDDSFKKGVVKTMYLCVAKAFARSGNMQNYNKYILKAREGVKGIKDIPVWKGTVFIGIVDAQLEAGDVKGAKETVREIKQQHSFSWGLYKIVKAQLKDGDIEGALKTSRDFTDTMNKSFAYGEIASAFVENGEFDKAEEVLLDLGNSSKEAEAYRRTAAAFVETGNSDRLAAWLDDIPSPQARVCACIGAVDGIMKLEKQSNAAVENDRIWLDNGVVKIAMSRDYGGAIVWVSASDSQENMINNADKGRQLQQSYYAGKSLDRTKEGQSPSWSRWSWNPVQAGNFKGDKSVVLDFEIINDGKTLYSKTQPRLWDMDGELAKCYMYQWVEIEDGHDNVIHVKNKLECFRDKQDIWGGPKALSQELPAVYAIRNMSKMVIYDGKEPWQNKPLTLVKYTDKDNWIWTKQNPTEPWAACLYPKNNFGIGVYSPSAKETWNMGWVGEKGTEFSGATMHFAPIAKWELSHNTIKDFEYWIIVGKIGDIRSEVYRLHSVNK